MKSDTRKTLYSFLGELVVYGILVTAYFFLVLHYLGGWLADHIGAPMTFVVGGAICLASAVAFYLQFETFRSHLRKAYVARGIVPSLEDTQAIKP